MTLSLTQANAELQLGRVIAVGTDTVYGLAAKLSEPSAIETIYELKERPDGMALPILFNGMEQAREMGVTMPERATVLSLLWPGALTIVLPAPQELATRVHGTDSVAIRIPDQAELLALLSVVGPLAVTSANPHGQPAATTVEMAEKYFATNEKFAGVYGEEAGSGSASTIVDLTGPEWKFIREGGISRSIIEALLFQE
jgi:L-threonylcarbamoyladenylate synthase